MAIGPEKTKKYVLLFLVSGTAVLLIFCGLLYFSVGRVKAYVPEGYDVLQDVTFIIDPIEQDGNIMTIHGFSFIRGESIETFKINALLRDIYTGEYFKLPTAMRFRPDVTLHFYDQYAPSNYNYDRSGWIAVFDVRQLPVAIERYEVAFMYRNDGNNILVRTGRRLVEI